VVCGSPIPPGIYQQTPNPQPNYRPLYRTELSPPAGLISQLFFYMIKYKLKKLKEKKMIKINIRQFLHITLFSFSLSLLGCHSPDIPIIHPKEATPDKVKRNIPFYEIECEKGNSKGCINMGIAYWKGMGIKKDIQKAHHYFQKACDLKDGTGCALEGRLYEDNNSTLYIQKAEKLYNKGCDYESGIACTWLADLYATEKIKKIGINDEKIAQLYKKGCDFGYGEGCTKLGKMYFEGKGVPKDAEESIQYFKDGCNLGDLEGCTAADTLGL